MAEFLKALPFRELFRSEAGNLKARIGDLRAQLETKKRRREDLMTLPLPPSDIAELLCGFLDARAQQYPALLSKRLEFVAKDPSRDIAAKPGAFQQLAVVMFPAEGMNTPGLNDVALMMAYAFGDEIKAAIRKALGSVKYPHGPGRAERTAELARLEHEIAELEAQQRSVQSELDAMRSELQ